MTLATDRSPALAAGPERIVTDLLADGGTIRATWGREPAVIHGSGLADLLPSADSLLDTPLLRPPFLTVLAGGAQVPPARYCRSEPVINISGPEYVVDRARLDAALAAGAALKLNRMELWSPPIATLAALLGAAAHRQVKVWGFLSPHGQMLVPVHRDPGHVMAVQVEGTKAWTLGGPCPDGPWSAMGTPVTRDETHVVLAAGDLLYMPYGYAHCAAATTDSSFHISFSLEGTTAGELRHRIIQVLVNRLDGTDSTEVRADNTRDILAGVLDAMGQVADRVRELPERDLGGIYSGRTAEVIEDLLR